MEQYAAAPKKQKSPWLYVGLGCGILILLGLIGIVVLGSLVFKSCQEGFSQLNPEVQEANALKLLGAERIPDGYNVAMAVSMAGTTEVILTTSNFSITNPNAPIEDTGPRRSFQYSERRNIMSPGSLKEWFEGATDNAHALAANGMNYEAGSIIGRGRINSAGAEVLYVFQRYAKDTTISSEFDLGAILLFECEGDDHIRYAVWNAELPEEAASTDPAADTPGGLTPGDEAPAIEAPAEEVPTPIAGTPVDEAALRDFLGHFNVCG